MKKYTVLVDALGFSGGCARKGEAITEEQIGAENVSRLLKEGFIQAEFYEAPKVAVEDSDPETLTARLSVGLPPDYSREVTDEEKAFIYDVKNGIVPVPFDADKVRNLTVKEIQNRIEGLGYEAPKNLKKDEALEALKDAIAATFEEWVLETKEEASSVE